MHSELLHASFSQDSLTWRETPWLLSPQSASQRPAAGASTENAEMGKQLCAEISLRFIVMWFIIGSLTGARTLAHYACIAASVCSFASGFDEM